MGKNTTYLVTLETVWEIHNYREREIKARKRYERFRKFQDRSFFFLERKVDLATNVGMENKTPGESNPKISNKTAEAVGLLADIFKNGDEELVSDTLLYIQYSQTAQSIK